MAADDWCVSTLRRVADDLNSIHRWILDYDFLNIIDSSRVQVEQVYRELVARELMRETSVPTAVYLIRDVLRVLEEIDENQEECIGERLSDEHTRISFGRPKIHIPRSQLVNLLNYKFTVPQIAEFCGTSVRTIRRRMSEYDLYVRNRYSNVSDSELDCIVKDIQHMFPTCGNQQMLGHLASRGIIVQQSRVRESQRRVDPVGSAMRKLTILNRRKYCVNGPLALWHIDGNHKLIRYMPILQIYNVITT